MSEDAQLKLRISQELREYIEVEAKNNHRTINGEVIFRLESTRGEIAQKVSYKDFTSVYPLDRSGPRGNDHAVFGEIEEYLENNKSLRLLNIETFGERNKTIRCWFLS